MWKDSFARAWIDIGKAAYLASRGWEWVGCWRSTEDVFRLRAAKPA